MVNDSLSNTRLVVFIALSILILIAFLNSSQL